MIAVTSAVAGEGRTTVALGLAEMLASDLGVIVTLVDADFDRPTITERFGMVGAPGLSDVIRGDLGFAEVGTMASERLHVVPAGSSSSGMTSLLRQLCSCAPFRQPNMREGVTVLDLPALLNEAYTSVAAQCADAVVLVVRAGGAPADTIRAAIARLEDNAPRGVVFIGAPQPPFLEQLTSWFKGRRRHD